MNIILTLIMLWFICFYLNRNGRIIPRIGGGCFGSPDTPELGTITPEQVITGGEGRTQAFDIGQEQFPGALEAREFAIDTARDPSKLNEFFAGLAPSPLAQSVQESAFGPLLDAAKRQALQVSSLQGIPSAFNANFSRAFAPTITSIGQFLSNLLENRGGSALANLFGVDPEGVLGPIAADIFGQSNKQANINTNANLFNTQAQFVNDTNQFNRDAAFARTIGKISPLAAFAVGGPEAGIGSFADALSGGGGFLSSVFGGLPMEAFGQLTSGSGHASIPDQTAGVGRTPPGATSLVRF